MARDDPERYDPLPPLTRLPGWLWGKLGTRGRWLVGTSGVVLGIAATLLTISMVRTGDRVAREEREREKARMAERRRELVADQRPRVAALPSGLPLGKGLEEGIDRDVRKRVSAGALDGPAGRTACTPVGRAGQTKTTRSYNCFVEATRKHSTGRTIVSGQRFVARIDLRSRQGTWCKTNPRPLHPDTANYVSVPISSRCQPPGR